MARRQTLRSNIAAMLARIDPPGAPAPARRPSSAPAPGQPPEAETAPAPAPGPARDASRGGDDLPEHPPVICPMLVLKAEAMEGFARHFAETTRATITLPNLDPSARTSPDADGV